MTPKPITATDNKSKRRYWIGSDRRYDRYNRSLVNRIEDLGPIISHELEGSHCR